ncbi:MAG: pyroglutamyl-peptidase I, partial [Planctomycetota bacterium]|nr:pyroglutamyl-peptidase I [Planctomycetota bacterium]
MLPKVLLTAFEPYGPWSSNASWLALVEVTRQLPNNGFLTTRRYPVDFAELPQRLHADLQANYDYVIHLGQSPGAARIQLEAVALNIMTQAGQPTDPTREL